MNAAALIEAADRNYIAAYERVARHARWDVASDVRHFGRAVAIVTGHPSVGFYNPVIATADGTPTQDVTSAIAWVRSLGLPVSVHVRDGVGDARLPVELRGFELEPDPWSTPVMAIHPIPDSPGPAADVRIEVADLDTFDRWRRVFAEGDEALVRVNRTFGSGMVTDPDVRFFSGSVDGRGVATSIAIRSDSVVGVYAVGTYEAYRRRGIGAAMTWAGVRMGLEWGCSTAVLQSSEMGLGVYQAMGFRPLTSYVLYEPGH